MNKSVSIFIVFIIISSSVLPFLYYENKFNSLIYNIENSQNNYSNTFDLSNFTNTLNSLKIDINILNSEKQQIEKLLSESNVKITEIENENQELNSQYNLLLSSYSEIQSDYLYLKSDYDSIKNDYVNLKNKLESNNVESNNLTSTEKLYETSSVDLSNIYDSAMNSVVTIFVYDGSEFQGNGSGFVYDLEGHILTNHHVIGSGYSEYVLIFSNEIVRNATFVGSDALSDIGVLKVDLPDSVKPLTLSDSSKLLVGESVYAFGSPFAFPGTFTSGIISQVNQTAGYGHIFYIQTDVALNPGNSGGPLINSNGHVIGMNTWGMVSGNDKSNVGINFAIPSNVLKLVVPDLIENGVYYWPFVGFNGFFVNELETESFSESEFYKDSGWNVTVVVPDTAAEKYGLQINDIILAIDDYDINRSHDLTYILNLYHSPGDTITFEILRNGDVIYLDFILGTR